ncbi:MAG: SPOR domain-containing protein [Sphingobium sp.]|uniref:SPOR domain-containing protein n=1 Tax=Sphingobium sp. TaxID=1912891 RepID=UPI002E1E54C3
MSFREGLRKGRSHLIFATILAVAGTLVVRIEDDHLEQETGRRPAAHAGVPEIDPARPNPPPSNRPTAAPPAATYVQIGAYASQALAERKAQAARETLDAANRPGVRVDPFRKLYRAQLGPMPEQDARALCDAMTARGEACRLVSP